MEKRFGTGIFLGIKGNSQEYIVGKEDGGVTTSNIIKRRPEDERWNEKLVKAITGTLWSLEAEEEKIELDCRRGQ